MDSRREQSLRQALQDIDDCFGAENKELQDSAVNFARSIEMLAKRWHKYRPQIEAVEQSLKDALEALNTVEIALQNPDISNGHKIAKEGVQKLYIQAFYKITDITYVELRDYEGQELQQALKYVAGALTAHLRDPSLLPDRSHKSIFMTP